MDLKSSSKAMTTISSKLNWIALFTCTLKWVSLPKTVLNTRSTKLRHEFPDIYLMWFTWKACFHLARVAHPSFWAIAITEIKYNFGQKKKSNSYSQKASRRFIQSANRHSNWQTDGKWFSKQMWVNPRRLYTLLYRIYIVYIYRLSLLVCSGVCILHNSTVDWLIAPPRGWAQNMKHK